MTFWILLSLLACSFSKERYIVKMHDIHAPELFNVISHFTVLDKINPIMIWNMKFLSGFVIECDKSVADRLAEHKHIEYVVKDQRVYPAGYINYTNPDPNYNWGLSRVSYPIPLPFSQQNQYAIPTSGQGANTHIYVFDSGINPSSSQFTGRIGTGAICINGCIPGIGIDVDGHGTACASIAVGNTLGIAQQAIVHPIQTYITGSGFTSDLIDGMYWALNEIATQRIVS